MGVMDIFTKQAGSNTAYQLTSVGRDKLNQCEVDGLELKLMEAIESPSTVKELVHKTGMESGRVRMLLRNLIRKQFIAPVGSMS